MSDEKVLDKFRMLTALYNGAATKGEQEACLAALSRLKAAVGPEAFATAQAKAKQSTADEEFLRKAKDRAARREAGFQRYQQQQRKRDFVKDTVNGFARPQPGVWDWYSGYRDPAPDSSPNNTRAMRSAYPNAYGDRRG